MSSDRRSQTSSSRRRWWHAATNRWLHYKRAPAIGGVLVAAIGLGLGGLVRLHEERVFQRHAQTVARDTSKILSDRLHFYTAHLNAITATLEDADGQLRADALARDLVQQSLMPYRSLARLDAAGATQWIVTPTTTSLQIEQPTTAEVTQRFDWNSNLTAPKLALVEDGSALQVLWPLSDTSERQAGAIAAILDIETAIAPYMTNSGRVAVELRDAEGTDIYRSHPAVLPAHLQSVATVEYPGGTWNLGAAHLRTLYPAPLGRLSWLVAAGGLVAGAIAASALRSRQRCQQQANFLSTTNTALANEIRDRVRVEAALSQQIEQASLLRQLTEDVRSSLDWECMLQMTVQSLGTALNVDRCTIHIHHSDAVLGLNVVAEYARTPYRSAVASLLSVGATHDAYASAVLAGDRAIVSHDVFATEWLASVTDLCQSLNVKSLLAARTSYHGVPNGAIEVHQCARFREWTTDEIALLEAIAAQVGIAIQQAELFRQQQQFNATLECQVTERTAALQEALELEALLQSITERVLYERDEAQILQSVTTLLAERLRLSTCEINTVDLDTSTHTVRYECARSLPSILGHTFSVDDDIASHTPFLLDGCLLYLCCTHPLAGWIAIVQCPIQDEQGIFGILNLIRPPDAEFSEAEIRLAQQVATQCAIALRQARLYEAAQQRIVDLQNLSVLKDDFLSTVSHELRSPLANMQMALKMLKLVPDPSKQERYLDVLDQACQQEVQLVDDLLDLQRLEAQCYQLAIEAIALELWLPEVVASFEPRARSRGLTLDVAMPQESLELHSDRACLERILRELLTNACKYSADGGCIRVTLTAASVRSETMPDETREGIRLEVSNPASISGAELPHIFEKFYRIPKSDRWRQGGTGLGLALVKQMMEQLQGSISVTVEQDTTTFALWLPTIPEFKPKWSGELTGTVPVQRNRLSLN